MSDKITITCKRCGHIWGKSLEELEVLQTIYRGDEMEKPKVKIVEYRAKCPVCGTYNIITVEED